jgi:integrase
VYYREHETRRHNGKPDRCFDITFKADGRKMWEKVGWSSENYTAAMAAQVRADRMRTIRHGGELPKRKKRTITFGEAWGKYYTWAQASKKSPETDEFRYRGVKAELADKPLNEISPFLLEKLKSRMSKDGLSAQSVRATLTLIGGVFNKARLWGHYDGENPVKKVKLPSVNNAARVRFLSPDEARALLEEVAKVSWQFYEMCLISLHTGLRAGEVFGLRWGDVDLENGIIRVADSKAGAARVAYMTDDLKRIFKEKTPGDPRDLLFLSQRGEKIKSVSGTFDNVVNRLGLNRGVDDRRQRVVFHTLRHTFGSWLALRGVPILTIKELMGHRRIEMTMRYAHLTPDAKREAVKGLQSFFDERSNGKTANEEGTK